jgi:hypothetical protein
MPTKTASKPTHFGDFTEFAKERLELVVCDGERQVPHEEPPGLGHICRRRAHQSMS